MPHVHPVAGRKKLEVERVPSGVSLRQHVDLAAVKKFTVEHRSGHVKSSETPLPRPRAKTMPQTEESGTATKGAKDASATGATGATGTAPGSGTGPNLSLIHI